MHSKREVSILGHVGGNDRSSAMARLQEAYPIIPSSMVESNQSGFEYQTLLAAYNTGTHSVVDKIGECTADENTAETTDPSSDWQGHQQLGLGDHVKGRLISA